MKSIKPGRGPSFMGGVVSIAIALFGVLWVIGTSDMTSEISTFDVAGAGYGGGSGLADIFPIFGVVFVIIAVAIAIYNFKNATGKNRYSEFDIVDGDEEPDPLNEQFGESGAANETKHDKGYCPYCGNAIDGDYTYCNRCGKRLPDR